MQRFILLITVFFFAIGLKAQQSNSVSLNLYGGYTFKDKVPYDGFSGYVKEAFQYGAGLEFFLQRTKSLELKYLRMDTDFPLYGPAGALLNPGKEKGSVNYILIGGNNYFGSSPSKAMPYGGIGLGIGIVDSKEGGSATKFAWDARLGVKINTSSSISFKLQAYIQSIIAAIGSDYYIYPGGGYIAIPDYATLFQFGLGGLVCFNFRKK